LRVKICGITNLEDAMVAVDAGADALGFVFYEKSPRYISPEKSREIIEKLPPFVERVGLFVNEKRENIEKIAKESGITLSQLHFEMDREEMGKLEVPYIPVIRAEKREDIELFSDRYRLVDAFVEQYGGAGKRVELDWFRDRDNSKIILAGGLTPENVTEVKDFGFFGVDVSSGVEERKGKKSHQKVRDFIEKAKQ
jgi:phosphoribosylanthranilate isomerase